MINLIPNEEKKKMVRDFYMRFVVVFFLVLGCSALIALGALMPSYFSSYQKKNVASMKLETQKAAPLPAVDESTISAISALSNKLEIIEKAEINTYDVSAKVINAIIVKKIPEIKITAITYKNDPELGRSVRLAGTASSREKLLQFRRALENDPAFKSVDLPISNFIKGSNISFFLNLIPA